MKSAPRAVPSDRRCFPRPRPGCWTTRERSRSSGSSLTRCRAKPIENFRWARPGWHHGRMPFFGYHMPSFTYPGVSPDGIFDHAAQLAKSAESAGFELVTVMDHFYQITGIGAEEEPMLEGYATLGALARETSRVRLATLVTGVTYRHPALVAKMVTTLDIISKGRMICGMGAAWNESEHIGYGIPFPPIRERMDRLDEALNIIRLMITQ